MEHGEQVYLLLSAPGEAPHDPLSSGTWRGWVVTDSGILDPSAAVGSVRLSPVAPRAERALVAALQTADTEALNKLAGANGPAQQAAQVLHALRCAAVAPNASIGQLIDLASSPAFDVADVKLLRRHWPGLGVLVSVAPSVPALVPISRTSLRLLAVELLTEAGRVAEAEAILVELPGSPVSVLMHAALLLSYARHEQVLELTSSVLGQGDVSALTLIARGVAARSLGDLGVALDAVCLALTDHARSAAVITAALEERAHLYSQLGESTAARDDLGALAQFASGVTDVTIPIPTTRLRGPGEHPDESLDRARDRLRRRITAAGRPGYFGGRHHSSYRDEIATMFGHGQVEAVEELLLCLLDAVEDEADETGSVLDPTFFLTLADLYQDSDRIDDLLALRERYEAAEARSGVGASSPAALAPRADTARPSVAAPAEPLSAEAVGAVARPMPALEVSSTPPVSAEPVGAPVAASFADSPALPVEVPEPPAAVNPSVDSLDLESRAGDEPGWVKVPEAAAAATPANTADLPKRSRHQASAGIAAAASQGGGGVALDSPPSAAGVPPEDDAPPVGDDAAAPPAEPASQPREMTAVERTIRGPRVRSL